MARARAPSLCSMQGFVEKQLLSRSCSCMRDFVRFILYCADSVCARTTDYFHRTDHDAHRLGRASPTTLHRARWHAQTNCTDNHTGLSAADITPLAAQYLTVQDSRPKSLRTASAVALYLPTNPALELRETEPPHPSLLRPIPTKPRPAAQAATSHASGRELTTGSQETSHRRMLV